MDVLCVNEVEACAFAGAKTFETDAVLTLLHEKYPRTHLLLTAGIAVQRKGAAASIPEIKELK